MNANTEQKSQQRKPLEYWRRLAARACKAANASPETWPAAVVREMAKGQREYPRAIASRVRALYQKDLARQQGND